MCRTLPLFACAALSVVGVVNAQSLELPARLRAEGQREAIALKNLPTSLLTMPTSRQVPIERDEKGIPTPVAASFAAPLTLRNGAIPTGLSGFYDYQSNGMSPGYIEVNPTDRQQIHTAMMLAADPDNQSATRRAGYAFSADGGSTWATNKAIGDVRLGFPYLQASNDGIAFIAAHGDPDGDGAIQTVLYFNSLAGQTDFSEIASLPSATSSDRTGGVIWPSFELTQNGEGAIVAASYSNTAPDPAAPLQIAKLDFATTPVWITLDSLSSITSGGRYIVARSAGGKIGIAWYRFAVDADDHTGQGIYLVESNDNGSTWGEIVQVMVGETYTDVINLNDDQDTIEAQPNLDMAYAGETPHIVTTASINNLYRYFGVVHWSPTTGLDYATVSHAVESMGGFGYSTTNSQPNMSTLSYPTISTGSDGQHILVVFQAIAQHLNETRDTAIGTLSPEGFEYFRLWGVGSANGGDDWGTPWIVQDFAGDGTDSASIEYPALDEHGLVGSGGNFQMNLQFLAKRFPGMYAFTATGSDPGPVNEQFQYYQREAIPVSRFVSTNSVAAETGASGLAITRLYPNPTTNTATVGISVPHAGVGSVEIWNTLGERVATLADGLISAGLHVYSLDARAIPTGRYFVALKFEDRSVTQSFSIVR